MRKLCAVGGAQSHLLEQHSRLSRQFGFRRRGLERAYRLGHDVGHAPARGQAGVRSLEDHLHALAPAPLLPRPPPPRPPQHPPLHADLAPVLPLATPPPPPP